MKTGTMPIDSLCRILLRQILPQVHTLEKALRWQDIQ
jgi:hypothetical protein